LWDEETLKNLLKDVGSFIRVDDITLNRSKGKFARVCLNIDITKPLRGSLLIPIPNQTRPLEVPISYEGLHEVCAWCGSNAHELDACPETPKGPIEVIVEKFGAAKLHHDRESSPIPSSSSGPLTEKWVTVAPKKRGRSFTLPRRKGNPQIVTVPASPSVKIVSPSINHNANDAADFPAGGSGDPSAKTQLLAPIAASDPSLVLAAPVAVAAGSDEPMTGPGDSSGPSLLAVSGARAVDRPYPSSPHFSHSSPASPLSGSALEDEDVDMFFNLEPEEEEPISPESTKKRKFEVGEASSPLSSPH